VIAALILGWAVLYADRTALYPLLSVIADTLGITSTQAGAITSAYFLFYVLLQIPSGLAADRWGAKRVLMSMFALSGLGILGFGLFGTSFSLLVFFSALHGLGAGAYYPCCFGTMLSTVPAEKRGISSGLIGMGMALGILGGMAVSGPLYQFFGNYRTPFLLLAVPTALMLPLFKKYLPDVKNESSPSLGVYKKLFRDRDIWKINIATFTSLYGFWAAATWGPTFLQAERSFSLNQSGLYTGLIALTALPGGVLWGRLSDRLGRKRTTLFVLPVSAAALFLLTRVESAPAIIATLLFFGLFSNTAFSPVAVAWIGDIVSRRHPGSMGAAIGFFNGTIMSSAVVAPLVSGFLRDLTGSLVPAILAGSILMFGGSVLLLFTPGNSEEKDWKRKEVHHG
jgi:MFS family permease